MNFRMVSSFTRALSFAPKNVKCMSFKSSLSLDKLYPNSVVIKPFQRPESPDGKFTGYIPIKELDIKFTTASGPGGQHVNKTETKVDVRFHVKTATWLSEATKQKLEKNFYTRINKDGYFVVKSEKTRSQLLNKADAIAYIRSVIFKLEAPEKVTDEETIEKHNRNKYKATRLRLMEKRSHSLLKSYRSQS